MPGYFYKTLRGWLGIPREQCSISSSPYAVSSWSPASSCTSTDGASCLASSSLSSPSCQSPRRRPRILHRIVDDRSMSDPCRIAPHRRRRYWRRDCASAQVYMALLSPPARCDGSAHASRQGPCSLTPCTLSHRRVRPSFTRAKQTCMTRLAAACCAAVTPCYASPSAIFALSVPRIRHRGSSGSTLAVVLVRSLPSFLIMPAPITIRSQH